VQQGGAVTAGERAELLAAGYEAFRVAGAMQATYIADSDPADAFIRLLEASLASGMAHVAGPDGGHPDHPQRWGWRVEEVQAGDSLDTRHRPQGPLVGWIDDGELYLEPDSSFAIVQKLAQQQNEAFTVTPRTLHKRLKEAGKLAVTDKNRGVLTVRRMLQGVRRNVLHIAPGVCPIVDSTRPTRPEANNSQENLQNLWSGTPENPTTKPDQFGEKPDQNGLQGPLTLPFEGRERNGDLSLERPIPTSPTPVNGQTAPPPGRKAGVV
jgi:hypothetical protein